MQFPRLRHVFDARPDVFSSIVIGAFIVSIVSGLGALISMDDLGYDDFRVVVAMVQILFALLCLSLILLINTKGGGRPGPALFIVAFAIVCLFLVHSGGVDALWAIVFPLIATASLGSRRGLKASLYFGCAALFLFFAPNDPSIHTTFKTEISFTLIYIAVAALSVSAPFAREPSGECKKGGSFDGANADVSGVGVRDLGVSAKKNESGVAGQGAGADEIVVYYRKDALDTIERVPEPEAVFSYLLLEGMSSSELFGRDNKFASPVGGNGPEPTPAGEYERRSINIDDLFAKVESVIDVREAKKLMEFNKIQSQIDSVLSRDSDDSSGFDRFCFERNLSEREAAVARCILKGATNKEISTELFISVETVKTHVKNLLKKCDINSRIDFIKLFSGL